MANKPESNNRQLPQQPSTWELIKKAREAAKAQKKIDEEKERQRIEEKKRIKKEDKQKLKIHIAEVKKKRKQTKIEFHKTLTGSKTTYKNDRKKRLERIAEIKKEWNLNKIDFSNDIRESKFEYGKKHRTFLWSITKWSYGIRKEFNRIVWSNPKNTFKYLGIIVFIVGFLSVIFLLITMIVQFIN